MKKANFILIITVLVIIVIILLGILVLFSNQEQVPYEISYEDKLRERYNIEVLEDNIIIPNRSYKFFTEVTTDVQAKEIYETLDYFFKTVLNKYIIEIESISNIEQYFNDNIDDIYIETGIDNLKDFKELVTKVINVSDGKKLNLQELSFRDNFFKDDGYSYSEIEAKYEGNSILIFSLKVYETKNEKGVFIEYNILD